MPACDADLIERLRPSVEGLRSPNGAETARRALLKCPSDRGFASFLSAIRLVASTTPSPVPAPNEVGTPLSYPERISAADPHALDRYTTTTQSFAADAATRAWQLGAHPLTWDMGAQLRTCAGHYVDEAAWVAVVAEHFRAADTRVLNVLEMARSQVGTREGRNDDNPYGTWFGSNHAPWCGAFVSWVFASSGHPLPAIQTKRGFMGVWLAHDWAQQHRRLVRTPQPGDVFFILRRNRTGHTGIVEAVNADGTVTTIEGNTNGAGGRLGDRVARRTRRIPTLNGGFYRPDGTVDPTDTFHTLPITHTHPLRRRRHR